MCHVISCHCYVACFILCSSKLSHCCDYYSYDYDYLILDVLLVVVECHFTHFDFCGFVCV